MADSLRQSPAQTFRGSAPAPLPNPGQHQQQRRSDAAPLAPSEVNVARTRKRGRGGTHLKIPPEAAIVPVEVQPRWGPLARYAASIDGRTYHKVVAAAKSIYNLMIGSSMGRQRLRHHPEGGACSGGDTGGRSSGRAQAPGERLQLRSDGRRRKQGGRGRERAHLFAARGFVLSRRSGSRRRRLPRRGRSSELRA